jgi:hypothetical protein
VVCREETLLRDSFVIATAARPPLFGLVHVEGFQIQVREVVHRVGRRQSAGGYAGGGAPRAALTAIEEVVRTALPQHRQQVGDGRD